MCYLKNIINHYLNDSHLDTLKQEQLSDIQSHSQENVIIPCQEKYFKRNWNEQEQMLIKTFQLIDKNNSAISIMNRVIAQYSQKLRKSDDIFEKLQNQPKNHHNHNDSSSNTDQISDEKQKNGNFTLCQQLFGNKKYQFHLIATHKFENIIYKQRNFNIRIKLVGNDLQRVRNSNLITLCLAVSTNNAKWIHQNRVGDPLLKGKTQIELYNGEATFQKVYARQVSRFYPEGKVAIVIYPKPSTLKYSTQGLSLEYVETNQIQPLILSNIFIRVKRKQ